VISTHLQSLPKKIKFVVEAAAALGLTSFKTEKLFSVFKVAYSTTKEGEDCPIQSQEELETFVNMACTQGIFKRLTKPGFYKFSHEAAPKSCLGLVYLSPNQSMRPGGGAGGRRTIGGGQGEVKAINLKTVGKTLGKGFKRSSVT
jgi:hypothetical protein